MNVHVFCKDGRHYDVIRYSHRLKLICRWKTQHLYCPTKYNTHKETAVVLKAPLGMEYVEKSFSVRTDECVSEFLYILTEYSDGTIKFMSPKSTTVYELRRK